MLYKIFAMVALINFTSPAWSGENVPPVEIISYCSSRDSFRMYNIAKC